MWSLQRGYNIRLYNLHYHLVILININILEVKQYKIIEYIDRIINRITEQAKFNSSSIWRLKNKDKNKLEP